MLRITAVEPPPPAWMNTSRRRRCAEGLQMSVMYRSLAPAVRGLVPKTRSHQVPQCAMGRPSEATAMLRITAVELPPLAWMNTSRRRWCADPLLEIAMCRSTAKAIRGLVPAMLSSRVGLCAKMQIQKTRAICRRFAMDRMEPVLRRIIITRQRAAPVPAA
jgi:hypothetical protein